MFSCVQVPSGVLNEKKMDLKIICVGKKKADNVQELKKSSLTAQDKPGAQEQRHKT